MGLLGFARVVFVSALISVVIGFGSGNVVLIGKNVSLSFADIEANFAPAIKESGECGLLHLADPLDACSPLNNKIVDGPVSPFALIIRGDCTFDDKLRNAQNAGFKAAVVYDNEVHGSLVAMAGTPGRIHIYAVFVSKASGEILRNYAGRTDVELWIIPTFENSAWSIMAISFISLLAMSAVLATCFFVRRQRIRREARAPNIREFHGMSSRLVKAMPSLIFTSVLEDNCTSATCAICLEDYSVGEKLRILPCRHKFHATCVDSWLTTWRTFCPVCKQDARTGTNLPPSECTPLLSSAASSPYSSFRSSIPSSPPIQINPRLGPTALSPLTNRTHSLSSGLPRVANPRRSVNASTSISTSRSFLDIPHASYNRSRASFHSLGFPQSSPVSARFMSPSTHSPGNGSPSYLGRALSGQDSDHLRHCPGSGTSLSAMDSAQSLPEC